ncbi:hypothetical protein [Paraburkholderia antibiotica]|uniref:Tetratricopeptide repeat protein n=1 Tax=Paraburkholderia antibiotica TaxID=2728839 RepID=A0A7X9X7E6_9BURK|nr:hypothetical protein [Paraburkholderia antibiotica]NML32337.1 hypothetical protein [Paraburkholderia antibiotica]
MRLTEDNAKQTLADADALQVRLLQAVPAVAAAPVELQEHLAAAWLRKIEALGTLGRHADAVTEADAFARYFDQGAATPQAAWPWLSQAACRKVEALAWQSELTAALEAAEAIQARFEHTEALAVREWVAFAALEEIKIRAAMGGTFARVDMVRRAQQLVERFGADAWPATRVLVGRIRLRQARMLAELDYDAEAVKAYTELRNDLARADDPGLQEVAAESLHERSRLFETLGRDDDAKADQQALIGEYLHSTHPGIRHTLALAQLDTLEWAQTAADASGDDAAHLTAWIAACDALIASHADSDEGAVVRLVNVALRFKARALRRLSKVADGANGVDGVDPRAADEVADAQWTRYHDHPDARVQAVLIDSMLERFEAGNDPRQAFDGAEQLLQHLRREEATQAVAPQLIRTLLLKSWALRAQGRPGQALEALPSAAELSGVADPASRELRLRVQIQRGQLLRQMKRPDEALQALQAGLPDDPAESDAGNASSDPSLHWLVARAMNLRIDIFADATPPSHDGTPLSQSPLEPSEQAYAQAVHALEQRFHADADGSIRAMVAEAIYHLAIHQREHSHMDEAIASYDLLLNRFATDTESAIEPCVASAYLNKAYLLLNGLDRPDAALPVYDALMARFANATSARLRDSLAKGAASRLTCLNRLQERGVAVNYGDQYEDLPLAQHDAIIATLDRADALRDEDRYREAIAQYDQVLTQHVESLHPELRRLCLKALVGKAFCFASLNQREASLATNHEAIERYGNDLSTSCEKNVALAMSNKAVDLEQLRRGEEALQVHAQIIERWRHASVAYLRLRVACAMFGTAHVLEERDPEAALAGYRQVMDDYLHASEPGMRLQAAKSAANIGILLRRAGRHAEAIPPCEKLLSVLGNDTDEEVRKRLVSVRMGLARSYAPAGMPEKAVAMYRELLALPPQQLSNAQRESLGNELRNLLVGERKGLRGLLDSARGWLR